MPGSGSMGAGSYKFSARVSVMSAGRTLLEKIAAQDKSPVSQVPKVTEELSQRPLTPRAPVTPEKSPALEPLPKAVVTQEPVVPAVGVAVPGGGETAELGGAEKAAEAGVVEGPEVDPGEGSKGDDEGERQEASAASASSAAGKRGWKCLTYVTKGPSSFSSPPPRTPESSEDEAPAASASSM